MNIMSDEYLLQTTTSFTHIRQYLYNGNIHIMAELKARMYPDIKNIQVIVMNPLGARSYAQDHYREMKN